MLQSGHSGHGGVSFATHSSNRRRPELNACTNSCRRYNKWKEIIAVISAFIAPSPNFVLLDPHVRNPGTRPHCVGTLLYNSSLPRRRGPRGINGQICALSANGRSLQTGFAEPLDPILHKPDILQKCAKSLLQETKTGQSLCGK